MSKNSAPPPPYGFQSPSPAPPSYAQAVNQGVTPVGPFTPQLQPNGTTILTTVVPIGPTSTHTICPRCQSEINTATSTQPGLIAYVSGFIICMLGCTLGCCLIPCCIDDCMDVHHNCPVCKSYLGRYRR